MMAIVNFMPRVRGVLEEGSGVMAPNPYRATSSSVGQYGGVHTGGRSDHGNKKTAV
jgi:hypothetical protein